MENRRVQSPEHSKFVLQDPGYSHDILTKVNSLRTEKVFTDATLCVGHEEFFCHRNILAASSPYFRAMFTSELREGLETRVSFNEISPWILKRIIEYVYTGKLEITVDNAQEMLAAGSLFQYPSIVEACCEFLKHQLHSTNCLGIEEFAQLHNCQTLQEEANKYTLDNFSSVVCGDEFCHISIDRLIQYLNSDYIDVQNEETVYDAVMTWLKYDLDERQCFMYEALEHVRLPVIDLNCLKAMEQDKLIRSCEKCLLLVKEAQEQHESIHDQHGRRRRSMQNSQVHPRPSTLAKEKLVVIGGLNNYVTKSVEMYDPHKDKWFDLPDFPKAVTWFSVSALSNSIVVTGGILDGHIIPNVWRFDSLRRTWNEIDQMEKPRARHASGAVDDRLFVLGGVTYDTTYSVIGLDTIECYDSVLKTWSVVGKCSFPRKQSQVVPYSNTLVEVGGLQGEAKVNTMDKYVLDENGTDVSSAGEQFILPEAIQFAQIVVMNGIFYIIWEDTKKVIALNPHKRTFQRLSDLNYAHKHSGATVLGEKIYLAGGLVDSRPSSIVECYDLATNKWTIEKSMLEPRAFHGCVTVQL